MSDTFDVVKNSLFTDLKELYGFVDEESITLIDNEILDHFSQWRNIRLKETKTRNQIEFLFPLLSDAKFLEKLDQFNQLGHKIIEETAQLRNAILSLTDPSFDYLSIKELARNTYNTNGITEFTREIILNLWATDLNNKGDSRSKNYLCKTVLPLRLRKVIQEIKENVHNDPDLQFKTIQTGLKPRNIIVWTKKI